MAPSLGKPEPAPYIDENDLIELAADLGVGWFSAHDLYEWYVAMIATSGRKPVTKKKFGMALAEAKWHRETRYVVDRMARCWLINKPWVRRGAAMLAAELEASKVQSDSAPSTGQPG